MVRTGLGVVARRSRGALETDAGWSRSTPALHGRVRLLPRGGIALGRYPPFCTDGPPVVPCGRARPQNGTPQRFGEVDSTARAMAITNSPETSRNRERTARAPTARVGSTAR